MAKQIRTTHKINSSEKWYTPFIIPGTIALVLTGAVLVFVKGEIDRFTLIMPIFAGFILYSILTLPDED